MKELVIRNIKLYFKDKLGFFLSLISPIILLLLFVTFLKNVYEQSLITMLPEGVTLSQKVLNGFTGGWLISSILGVSCVTIAFCSNTIMVTDRIENIISDFNVTPIKKYKIALSYFIANFICTMIVCLVLLTIGFIYIAAIGWYLSLSDVLFILVVLLLNVCFGCLLSGIALSFVSTQGGISASATLVSSLYGFLCGAYMPISQFSSFIQTVVAFIPGTYSTVLFRRYFMFGCLDEISQTVSGELAEELRNAFDGNLYVYDYLMTSLQMYTIIISSIVVMLSLFLLRIYVKNKRKVK